MHRNVQAIRRYGKSFMFSCRISLKLHKKAWFICEFLEFSFIAIGGGKIEVTRIRVNKINFGYDATNILLTWNTKA